MHPYAYDGEFPYLLNAVFSCPLVAARLVGVVPKKLEKVQRPY